MINKAPQIHLIYNRRKTASLNKKASVEIRITYNYQQKYISTGIMLYPYQWKNGIITNCENILQISQVLNKQLTEVRQVLLNMINEGDINLKNITKKIKDKKSNEMTFIDFCKQRINIRKYNKKEDTQQRYDRFLKAFLHWGIIKDFDEITDNNIIIFDKYLNTKGMKSYSKWHNYHRFLNSFIIDAINEGYINKNPYKWININKNQNTETIHKHLTSEEFAKIKKVKLPTESLVKVRDVFIFQTYTCLSYSDLKNFNINNLKHLNKTIVYTGDRKKTNKDFIIPILKPAQEILLKYNNNLPIISNVKYNQYLKIIAQAAGINKPLSSHWARHTGATLLLNEGVDIKIVSKICGHSSIRITEQIYAKLLDKTVVKALENISI